MSVVVDASVALRWFVEQHGGDEALAWLERSVAEPDLLIAPDLLRFQMCGALARLQPRRDPKWAARCFARFDRLGLKTLPTTHALFDRAFELSRALKVAGYDAIYLAHAEAIGVPWLTADAKALRRLAGDRRVMPLVA